jgi:hypothetical protein
MECQKKDNEAMSLKHDLENIVYDARTNESNKEAQIMDNRNIEV